MTAGPGAADGVPVKMQGRRTIGVRAFLHALHEGSVDTAKTTTRA